MKTQITISTVITILLLSLFYVLFIRKDTGGGYFFVDTIRLNNEFNYTKDMFKQVETKFVPVKKEMDSLSTLLQVSKNDSQLIRMYQEREEILLANYKNIEPQVQEKAWERLNAMIEEYCIEKKIKLIIGANGMGTVLYGEEDIDLTSDLINYVNKKYETGN